MYFLDTARSYIILPVLRKYQLVAALTVVDLAETAYPIHIGQGTPNYAPCAKSGLRGHFINKGRVMFLR